METNLVDCIYEAAAVPELWPEVLARIARRTGGAGASFVTAGRGPIRWVATPELDALIRDFLDDPVSNPRMSDVIERRYPGFVTDHDIFPESLIDSHPFYRDFMRPRGFGWCAGAAFFPPSTDPIILAVEKRYADGPFERRFLPFLEALRPHLARATLLSAQLAIERAQATAEALGRIGLPAAVLDDRHTLRAVNDRFAGLVPDFVLDRREQVVLADKAADALLADALSHLKLGASRATRSIPIRGGEDRLPAVFHLLPVRHAARDVFAMGAAILVATPVEPSSGAGTQVLEALFDLTPTEAAVARLVGDGLTLDDIAARLGVSRNTVRTHLRAVFAKTATARQAELVRLLGSLRPFPAA